MKKWLLRIFYAFICLGVGTAAADYTATQGAGSTVFAFVCFTTKICPAHVLTNSAGTEIGNATTPVQVSLANTATNATAVKTDGSAVTQPVSAALNSYAAGSLAAGAGVDGWDLTQGTKADAAYTTGSGSVIAILKGIYNAATAQLAPGTNTIGNVGSDPSQGKGTPQSAPISLVVLATPVNSAFSTATTGGTLANGTSYYYRVTATNAAGETLASTETSLAIAGPVAAPSGLAVTANSSGGTFAAATYYWEITATNSIGETTPSAEVSVAIVANGTASLTWTADSGATGYKIYRSTTSGGESTSPALVATVGAVTSYTDTGTATSSGATPASNTTATSTNTVTVNWGAVTGATGYKIYGRSTGAELFIASVSAPTVTYTDTGSITPSGALPAANTTASSAQIVALSGSTSIYVTSFDFIMNGTSNVSFVYGTGTNCGTGQTALTGLYPATAQVGVAKGSGIGTLLKVPSGNALCILSSAGNIAGGGSASFQQF